MTIITIRTTSGTITVPERAYRADILLTSNSNIGIRGAGGGLVYANDGIDNLITKWNNPYNVSITASGTSINTDGIPAALATVCSPGGAVSCNYKGSGSSATWKYSYANSVTAPIAPTRDNCWNSAGFKGGDARATNNIYCNGAYAYSSGGGLASAGGDTWANCGWHGARNAGASNGGNGISSIAGNNFRTIFGSEIDQYAGHGSTSTHAYFGGGGRGYAIVYGGSSHPHNLETHGNPGLGAGSKAICAIKFYQHPDFHVTRTGNIKDSDGNNIPNARVYVVDADYNVMLGFGTTNASGNYSIRTELWRRIPFHPSLHNSNTANIAILAEYKDALGNRYNTTIHPYISVTGSA